MGKQWARQQVRRDEMQSALEKAVNWTAANRSLVIKVVGGALAALALGGGLLLHRRHIQGQAWERLAFAQALAYGGRPDQALEQLQKLSEELPAADASGYGRLLSGDIQYQRGNYTDALASYAAVQESGRPAAALPLALGDTAIALEASGKPQEAVQSAQRFLETYPDHFFAPQVHACLARSLQALGQAEQAKAAYQKIVLQYPDTSWAAWAQAKLAGS